MAKFQNKISIKNKKAYFDYEITDEFVAGIQLLGTEVKSIRESKASIKEAYCYVNNEEIFIKGMSISEYSHGGYTNHEIYRLRKLLLNRKEINKIEKKLKDNGFSLLPILLFINDKGLIKLKIGIGRGKKLFDKRQSLKQKDVKKDIARLLKN